MDTLSLIDQEIERKTQEIINNKIKMNLKIKNKK